MRDEFFLSNDFEFINEEFYTDNVSEGQIDRLLAEGWRHFGTRFFRYSVGLYQNELRLVIPLRIRLADFSLSKSLRRILKKNTDLETFVRPAEVTEEKEVLFERHKKRFGIGSPKSIYDFVSFSPADVPSRTFETCVYQNGRLLAASFFDVGGEAVSGIYAMFDPEASSRSLGIMTMLLEIGYSIGQGKAFYYQGYCYEGSSFYDYKKRFRATEKYDWKETWSEL